MCFKKITLFLAGLAASFILLGGQNDNQELQEMTKADIGAIYANIRKGLAGDEKTPPVKFAVYKIYADMISEWITKYRFLEADTEIDKSWFEKTVKMLEYMAQCKEFIELAQSSGDENTEEFKKVKSNLEEAYKRFSELVKNPTPVDRDKLEKLRSEKYKWEAEKRRENAKKNGTAVPDGE